MIEVYAKAQLDEAKKVNEKAFCSLETLKNTTEIAHKAIQDQDLDRLAQVSTEISKLKEDMETIKSQLYTDTLTSARNRKWLSEHILHENEFIDHGVFVFVDLDQFRPINKNHGTVIGDKVLQYLATFLKTNLQEMEVIRYAGDEFIIISKHDHMEEIYMKFKKLQEELLNKKLKASNGELLYLSFSFGVTRFEKGSSFREILEMADNLMHENKRQKKAS